MSACGASDPRQGGAAGDNLRQQSSSAASSSGTTTDDRVAAPEDQVAVPEDTEAEWQHYNFFLDQLLGLISRGEEEAVSRVISVIRSGGSHREILDIIEQQSEIQPERNGSIKDVPRAWRGSKGGHETTPGSSA